MENKTFSKKIALLFCLLFLLNSCTEYILTRYSKTNKSFYQQKIDAGYLVNNNKPNGLPKRSLLVHFKNENDTKNKKIISVTSVRYGNFEKITNKNFSAIGTDGILFLKPLEESRKMTLQKIKTDTIKIIIEDNNRIETVLFYN